MLRGCRALATSSTGVVRWYDAAKGFGFITRDSDTTVKEDIFVNYAAIPEREGVRQLFQGEKVQYEFEESLGKSSPVLSLRILSEEAHPPRNLNIEERTAELRARFENFKEMKQDITRFQERMQHDKRDPLDDMKKSVAGSFTLHADTSNLSESDASEVTQLRENLLEMSSEELVLVNETLFAGNKKISSSSTENSK